MTLSVTDMFCGAGGSSIGVTAAGASVRLAMNHWPVAIESHAANFPGIDHACVNVATSDPAYFPTTDILIASPECDAHTYAGGRKRSRQHPTLFDLDEKDRLKREAEARSRATMFDVPRWAEYHRYAAIIVENVLEIFDWILVEEWLAMMAKLGYRWQVCSFNSMFFGGGEDGPRPPQSRDRTYIVFTRTGNPKPDLGHTPTSWCPKCGRDVPGVQSFKRPDRARGRYRRQYVYRCPACATEVLPYVAPAASIIDWSLPAPLIGERKRPLAATTRARIRTYLERHGWGPADQPSPWVDTARRHAAGRDAELPLTTVSAEGNHHYLVEPFIDTARINAKGRGVDQPLTTLSSGPNHYLVLPGRGYIVANYSPGYLRDADQLPIGSITGHDSHGLLVQVAGNTFERPSSTCRTRSTDELLRTQTGTLSEALLVPAGGSWNTDARPADEPLRTLTSRESNALVRLPADFLLPYSRTGKAHSTAEPLRTLTGKDRYALARPPTSSVADDLDTFIDSCGYRMFGVPELGGGMAFPGWYTVTGNREEQVAQYGNAVTPPVMSWIFRQVAASLAHTRASVLPPEESRR